MSDSQYQLIVECKIVGHASPRWKSARTENERIRNNEIIANSRALNVKKLLETHLRKELPTLGLEFRYDQTLVSDDSVPSKTVVVGHESRGERDTIAEAGGNKSANDEKYRRVDISVRIARKETEFISTTTKHSFIHPEKSIHWWVSIGADAGFYYKNIGGTFLLIQIRNTLGQTALGTGIIVGFEAGYNVLELFADTTDMMNKLIKPTLSVDFGDEASFMTDRPVTFSAFSNIGIGYDALNATVGLGYSMSRISFFGLGRDAINIPLGGFTLSGGFGPSISTGNGIMFLHSLPGVYADSFTMKGSKEIKSEYTANQVLSVYFEEGDSVIIGGEENKIKAFAARVAKDILS